MRLNAGIGKVKGGALQVENKITFERLPYLLGDKAVMELFLSQLLGRVITLKKPPEVARPWYSIHCVPDIRAVSDDEIITICIGPCGMGPLMSELQETARQCEGVARERHIIMFCREAPPFANRQSYCKVGPAVLNLPTGEAVPVEDSSIYYHILSCSRDRDAVRTAPEGIQRLLDILSAFPDGEIFPEEEVLPDSQDESDVDKQLETALPLEEMLLQVEHQWLWMDNLRRYKKEIFAKDYASAISEGFSRYDAAELAAVGEEAFEEGYIEARLERINTLPLLLRDLPTITNDTLPLELLAENLEVPPEVVQGVLDGKKYTEDDFRRMYGRGG